MLQGRVHSMAVSAKKGSAADVTPAAVNWADVYQDNEYVVWGYSERQITGINQTITLKVEYDTLTIDIYYFVSSSAGAKVSGDATSATSPSGFSMNFVENNGTFTVSNNQYVTFGVMGGCTPTLTITVKNQSDSNATLDTFLAYSQGEC